MTHTRFVLLALLLLAVLISSTPVHATSYPNTPNCVDLPKNLTLGSSASYVSSLQQYLISGGLLDAPYNTGYYGFITTQAVGKLQIKLGILSSVNDSAYGITGPRTRAAIACSGNTPATAAPTCSLRASVDTITSGESTTLSWTSTGTDYVVPPGGDKDIPNGSGNYAPYSTKTYVFTFYGPGGQTTCSQRITVTPASTSSAATPTCALSTDKTSYNLRDTVTLSWTSRNATSAGFASDTSGKDYFVLPGDKLEANGSQKFEANVIGNPSVTLNVSNTAGRKGSCSITVPVQAAPVLNLTVNGASSATIPAGSAATIMWTTQNVKSGTCAVLASLPNDSSLHDFLLWHDNSSNSTGPLTVPGTYIYSLACQDLNGTQTKTVSVPIIVTGSVSSASNLSNLAAALTGFQSAFQALIKAAGK